MSEMEPRPNIDQIDQEVDSQDAQRSLYRDVAIDRAIHKVSSEEPLTGWDAIGSHLIGGSIGCIVGLFVSGAVIFANREVGINLAIPILLSGVLIGVGIVTYAEAKIGWSQRE